MYYHEIQFEGRQPKLGNNKTLYVMPIVEKKQDLIPSRYITETSKQ